MSLIRSLSQIRKELEQEYFGFPEDYCGEAASKINKELGLPVARVLYKQQNEFIVHYVNYKPSSHSFIDITADQYDESNKPIIIIPIDSNEFDRYYSRKYHIFDM